MSVPWPPTPVAPPAAAPLRIDFHNALAVRTGLLTACLASMLNLLPVVGFGCPLWLMAAGFLAVYLYSRRTGQLLPVRQGMKIGWITGIFSFVIYAVVFTILFVSTGGFSSLNPEQMRDLAFFNMNVEETLKLMQDPVVQAIGILLSLFFLFVVFTLIPVLGGAIGARVMQKD